MKYQEDYETVPTYNPDIDVFYEDLSDEDIEKIRIRQGVEFDTYIADIKCFRTLLMEVQELDRYMYYCDIQFLYAWQTSVMPENLVHGERYHYMGNSYIYYSLDWIKSNINNLPKDIINSPFYNKKELLTIIEQYQELL